MEVPEQYKGEWFVAFYKDPEGKFTTVLCDSLQETKKDRNDLGELGYTLLNIIPNVNNDICAKALKFTRKLKPNQAIEKIELSDIIS